MEPVILEIYTGKRKTSAFQLFVSIQEKKMKKASLLRSFVMILILTLLSGFSAGFSLNAAGPLDAKNINLIFVVSPDLAYQASGDVNPDTGNLTNQGLQRSLLMATYLKTQVLGSKNVNRIFTIEPMTHLQTEKNLPDMAAMGYIQQFAMLNKISLTGKGGYGSPFITSNSYPLAASYAADSVPEGVAKPAASCFGCTGLDFNDAGGSNEKLVAVILETRYPGYFVFSAPWETVSSLMANINEQHKMNLSLPKEYEGPNMVYAISVSPAGGASLVTYDSKLKPGSGYPKLPSTVPGMKCKEQPPFTIEATDGKDGAKLPAEINTNETVYMVRHAEAHPTSGWDDGNYVAAGQWRALALPNALKDKISPTEVYSIDPAQVAPGSFYVPGNSDFSYVRAALTVEPYAISNNLPYYLVSEFELLDPDSPKNTSDKFFTGGAFSNKTILLAWEHDHFPPTIAALLANYYPADKAPKVPGWPDSDYDTVWTVTLDAKGNLTVNNTICEGIDSTKLPETAPKF
jgi:hypothetical protein